MAAGATLYRFEIELADKKLPSCMKIDRPRMTLPLGTNTIDSPDHPSVAPVKDRGGSLDPPKIHQPLWPASAGRQLFAISTLDQIVTGE